MTLNRYIFLLLNREKDIPVVLSFVLYIHIAMYTYYYLIRGSIMNPQDSKLEKLSNV
jgi:hypothetical protein